MRINANIIVNKIDFPFRVTECVTWDKVESRKTISSSCKNEQMKVIRSQMNTTKRKEKAKFAKKQWYITYELNEFDLLELNWYSHCQNRVLSDWLPWENNLG